MANFIITSADDLKWSLRLGDCSKAHARSVLAQLSRDASVPHNLRLKRLHWFSRRPH